MPVKQTKRGGSRRRIGKKYRKVTKRHRRYSNKIRGGGFEINGTYFHNREGSLTGSPKDHNPLDPHEEIEYVPLKKS
jgi:hypothetical protein